MGADKQAQPMKLGEAVQKGIIGSETLAYFIGRTFLYMKKIGMDAKRLRFRQHLQNEMAHYASDCWDAEAECSYGWIECAGLSDRSAFDLKVCSPTNPACCHRSCLLPPCFIWQASQGLLAAGMPSFWLAVWDIWDGDYALSGVEGGYAKTSI